MKSLKHYVMGICLLITAAICSGCGGAVNVRTLVPTVVTLPQGATAEQVGKAVRLALVGRGWSLENDAADSVDGQLTIRGDTVRVKISYDASSATILYLSGSRLSRGVAQEGAGSIVYSRWVQNLAKDIPIHLQRTLILGD